MRQGIRSGSYKVYGFYRNSRKIESTTLATTVLQTCIRYGNSATKCQFCAIGESLKAGRTIAKKTPEQLAEVAAAAQRLDGIANVVMTIGTPPTDDRGAAVLSECAIAVKSATNLPIQAQCEPPSDFGWFARMRNAGVDSLGMHLEAWDENVRRRIMPGKAEVTRAFYLDAFIAAVSVFGRGQVSTYLLAVLGDTVQSPHEAARALIDESAHCRAVANALLRHCDRWRTGGTLRQLPAKGAGN
jgi:radical SAM protein (TIGR04043 family)